MATRLYFHDAAYNGWAGTFPTTELSTATATVTNATALSLRTMDTAIGASQVAASITTSATTTAQKNLYRVFVSAPLASAATLSGNFSYWIGMSEANAAANVFPSVNIYGWRPSTGTKVGAFADYIGIGSTIGTEAGTSEQSVGSSSITAQGTPSLLVGDVIVVEVWMQATQSMATGYATNFYYDGSTVSTTANAAVASMASFVEFTENLTFSGPKPLDALLQGGSSTTASVTYSAKNIETVWSGTGTTSVSLPGGSGGLALAMAYNDANTTIPTLPSGWTSIATATGTSCAARLAMANVSALSAGTPSATQRSQSVSTNLYSVAYGNGVYVAIASDTANVVATSTDGITWTQRSLPSSSPGQWATLCFGGGQFVAVSSGAVAATSPDGITWTQRTMPNFNWQRVCYGGGVYVATAANTNASASSPDGITWTQRTMPATGSWTALAFGNGQFVAALADGSAAATSPDGITWTQRTMASPGGTGNWASIAYGNGIYVATASSQNSATSTDGITWTSRSMPSSAFWYGLAFGAGLFVSIGYNSNTLAYSSDGIVWSTTTMPLSDLWISVAYGANFRFVCAAISSSNMATIDAAPASGIFTNATSVAAVVYKGVDPTTPIGNVVSNTGTSTTPSTAALTLSNPSVGPFETAFVGSSSIDVTFASKVGGSGWSIQAPSANPLFAIATNGSGSYVAVGFNGTIAYGALGSLTSQANTFGTTSVYGVAYGGGVWVAVGEGGVINRSTNGTTWSAVTSNAGTNTLLDVFWNGSLFVAVGSGGALVTSPDGSTWTARVSGFGADNIASVYYGGGMWVCGGWYGKTAYSTNGTTWTFVTAAVADTNCIRYGNGVWIQSLNSGSGDYRRSTDGMSWTYYSQSTASGYYAVYVSSLSQWQFVSALNGSYRYSTDGLSTSTSTFSGPANATARGVLDTPSGLIVLAADYVNGINQGVATYSTGTQLNKLASQVDATDAIAVYDTGGAAPQV